MLQENGVCDNRPYLNANHVSDAYFPNQYIACQGPLTSTQYDFWKMIWVYKSPLILMLTRTFESGRVSLFCLFF